MKAFSNNRVLVLLLAFIGIVVIGILASGIREMEFREPEPFYFEIPVSSEGTLQTLARQLDDVPMEQVILFWSVVLIMTVILILIINPRYRWKILRAVLRAAITFTLLTWGLKAVAQRISENMEAQNAARQAFPLTNGQASPPVFVPPEDVSWLSYGLGLVFILVTLLAGWWLWNIGFNSQKRSVRNRIAEIARDALGDMSDGRDFHDTVTNCYLKMVEAVNSERGLQRQEAMTPSEFALRLEGAGLPGEPVHRLTRLFESVRYGGRQPGQVETNEAVFCLNAIIAACGENQ